MNVRTLAGLGVVATWFVVSASSRADLLDVTIVEVTADVGTPEGFVTYRVVANFDGMDQVLAWGGLPGVDPLLFFTGGGDLLNAGGKYAGLKEEDFAAFPISEAYDSWVTVGATELAGNQTDYSGFGSDGIHAVIVGSSLKNGFVFDSDPTSPVLGPEVALAQFTLPENNGFHLEGGIAWKPPGAGDFIVTPFIVDNIIPAPGGLALLGLIGLAGPRRCRGSAAASGPRRSTVRAVRLKT